MTDSPARGPSIRNAVIHLTNEQPLLADLFEVPAATDLGLVCTNLRTMAGKRPAFVDDSASLFYIPYAHMRFLEISPAALGRRLASGESEEATPTAVEPTEAEADLELDEEFLRRIREV
jgi:hypothetical protein